MKIGKIIIFISLLLTLSGAFLTSAAISQKPVSTRPEIKAALGQLIEFGSWEQDNDPANGSEPIHWKILRIEDDFALVISIKGLEARPWHEELNDTDWSNSSLRTWLNGEFYEKAFGSSGADYIVQSLNSNPGNPGSGNGSGRNTNDRVFLLSLDEAAAWLPTDADRIGGMSAYTEAQGAIGSSEYGMWWLRTSGRDKGTAAYVDMDGRINGAGLDVNADYMMVRPAFWLRLKGTKAGFMPPTPEPMDKATIIAKSTDRPTPPDMPTNTLNPTATPWPTYTPFPTATPWPTYTPFPTAIPWPTNTPFPTAVPIYAGDIITFGHYEQDNNFFNGAEPIEWQVLAVEENRILVISRYGLDVIPYNNTYKNVTWERCSLRSWLNREFYEKAFTAAERSLIQQVQIKNPDNRRYGTAGGNNTSDRIFLLSINEANTYFFSDNARHCKATAYAAAHGAWVSNISTSTGYGYSWWWLRSPGSGSALAAVVYARGDVDPEGDNVNNVTRVTRPAMWLNR